MSAHSGSTCGKFDSIRGLAAATSHVSNVPATEPSHMKPFSRVLIPLLLMSFGAVSARADDKADVLAANTQVEQAFTKLDVKA